MAGEGAGIDPSRLVFLDGCGSSTGMARSRSRAPRGERAYAQVPRNRGPNTTIIASISLAGRLDAAAMTLEGAADSAVFEAYVEDVLCPALRRGGSRLWTTWRRISGRRYAS